MVSTAVFLSVFTLLPLCMAVYFLSKKSGIPYTVLLVITGVLMVPLARTELFSYLANFNLTTDLLFFVFLPVLIFESAYNMDFREAWENKFSISALAVVGLLISAFGIAFVGTWLMGLAGIEVPFLVMLLFGTIISATDPVAVLALFKEFGAPKRLVMLFEGESLFNDATAFAMFLILLEVIQTGANPMSGLGVGFVSFLMMMIGGVLFGGAIGVLFSKLIEVINNNEKVEITLTMVVAHLTFILAELITHNVSIFGVDVLVSSIVATVVASMVIGNYGRYKISPRVEEYMDKFWEYFAFVANSLVFIMMGTLFARLFQSRPQFLWPVLIAILVTTVARVVSVYLVTTPLNWLKVEEPINKSWQKLMAVGDLKGALAVIMLLFIPKDLLINSWPYEYSAKDFLTVITVGCIFFTLFVKAPLIGWLIEKLGINGLSKVEKLEYMESKALIYSKVLNQMTEYNKKGYVGDEVFKRLKKKYSDEFKTAKIGCDEMVCKSEETFESMLRLYAIGIERHALKKLFIYDEVNEVIFKKLMSKLSWQESCVERGILKKAAADAAEDFKDSKKIEKIVGKDACAIARSMPFWERYLYKIYDRKIKEDKANLFAYYRALQIISRKVVKDLKRIADLSEKNDFGNKKAFERVIKVYEGFKDVSAEKMADVMKGSNKKMKEELYMIEERFALKGVKMIEEKVLEELESKGMITKKLSLILAEELNIK